MAFAFHVEAVPSWWLGNLKDYLQGGHTRTTRMTIVRRNGVMLAWWAIITSTVCGSGGGTPCQFTATFLAECNGLTLSVATLSLPPVSADTPDNCNPAGVPSGHCPHAVLRDFLALSIRDVWRVRLHISKGARMALEHSKAAHAAAPSQARTLPEVRVPRNLTATLQLIQLFVISAHTFWIGGTVVIDRWELFLRKMAGRYKLDRSERMRVYDRQHARASVHLVARPSADGRKVQWMLLSTEGKGGLLDMEVSPLEKPGNARLAEGRLTWGDYELVYASKKWVEAYRATARSGKTKERRVLRRGSTWTWRITQEAARGVSAAILDACASMDPFTVRNVLEHQATRPLFAGVREQVVQFGQQAREAWRPRHNDWLVQQKPALRVTYCEIDRLLKPHAFKDLYIMTKIKVYDDVPVMVYELTKTAVRTPGTPAERVEQARDTIAPTACVPSATLSECNAASPSAMLPTLPGAQTPASGPVMGSDCARGAETFGSQLTRNAARTAKSVPASAPALRSPAHQNDSK